MSLKFPSRRVHKLKIEQPYLDALLSGDKTFEVRFNDRGYQKGDVLELHVPTVYPVFGHPPKPDFYWFEVGYVHAGLGMAKKYAVMSVSQITREEAGLIADV